MQLTELSFGAEQSAESGFSSFFATFLSMLHNLVEMPTEKHAQAAFDLFIKLESSHLESVAAQFWKYRHEADLERLNIHNVGLRLTTKDRNSAGCDPMFAGPLRSNLPSEITGKEITWKEQLEARKLNLGQSRDLNS